MLNECSNSSFVSVEGLSHVSVKAKISNSISSVSSNSNFEKNAFYIIMHKGQVMRKI